MEEEEEMSSVQPEGQTLLSPEKEPRDEGQKVNTDNSRLMIAKIVCEDFKSYAGVKELGPFHKVS